MRILIDGHCLGDKSGGNETYWKNLIKYINLIDKKNKYTIYINKYYKIEYDNFVIKKYFSNNTIWRNCISIPINLLKGYDIIHTQYFTPLFTNKKNIVTIHDISFETFPEYFSHKELLINKYFVKKAAILAKGIITVSEFSKNDISNKYNIDPDKIYVTYLAANERYKIIKNTDRIRQVINNYNIKYKYILSVGNLQPRKNLDTLIKAFNKIKLNNKYKDLKLVIVGKLVNKNYFKSINNNNDIIFTDYVPDNDLPYLYNGCEIFVYPSVFEGFGLPPLEAMKCGKVVIASNKSSIPEVVGDGGILFNPFNIDELYNKILNVLEDEDLKHYYENAAIRQAKKFSWENTAKKTIMIYKKLYNMKN